LQRLESVNIHRSCANPGSRESYSSHCFVTALRARFMRPSSLRSACVLAILAWGCRAAAAQTPLSDAERAALQIQTANGSPVHVGDTLSQVHAALPSAPERPQIDMPAFATLWDQVDGIILRLSHDTVTGILYDAKSHAHVAGFDIGIGSTLADFEKVLGPSRLQAFPAAHTWPLDEKHQLVANLNAAGVVTGLELGFIPKPQPRPTSGVINWANTTAPTASTVAASAPEPVLTGDARSARLDGLLQRGDDVDLLQTLFPQMRHQAALPREVQAADLAWLERHAGEGRASVLYALSWRLVPVDRERARSVNARARVEWMLASAQCAHAPQPTPLMFMLEGEMVVDMMPLRKENPAWAIAIEQALDWDRSLAAPVEAGWYCGTGNVKPVPDAAAARQAYWQRIRDSNHPKTTSTAAP
jgi:hypothetical protein